MIERICKIESRFKIVYFFLIHPVYYSCLMVKIQHCAKRIYTTHSANSAETSIELSYPLGRAQITIPSSTHNIFS
jgi:hypothetical protein